MRRECNSLCKEWTTRVTVDMPHTHTAAPGTSMQAKAGAGTLSSAVNRSSLRALSLGENNRIDPKKADVLRLNIGSSRDDACIVHTLGAVG